MLLIVNVLPKTWEKEIFAVGTIASVILIILVTLSHYRDLIIPLDRDGSDNDSLKVK